jgi:hypothetical protein
MPWEEIASSFEDVVKFIEVVRERWVEGRDMTLAWTCRVQTHLRTDGEHSIELALL